jgi:hypothetical protein
MGGIVLAATRGDFGTRMLEARTTNVEDPASHLPSRVEVVRCPLRGVDIHRPGERFWIVMKLNQHCYYCCNACQYRLGQE